MAQTTKPRGERPAIDREPQLPIPQVTPRSRPAGAGDSSPAAGGPGQDPAREEYPGPQTSSSGGRIEPGTVRPTTRRGGSSRA
jgi:hypothetical protein